jgi:phosphoribosyl-ATP pyrophosphohydrolase/phosphoribosyl-AMP cyclohydrolase
MKRRVPAWDSSGLVPAVVVDAQSFAPLMLAWMDREALEATEATGFVHFHSRSRDALWKKGESSGNTLRVVELRIDCDSDAILVVAEPAGPTCHTGRTSCFYARSAGESTAEGLAVVEDDGPGGAAAAIVERVYAVLEERRDSSDAQSSYTRSLLEGGIDKISGKIAEESGELVEALSEDDDAHVVHEAADLLFHVLVGLCGRRIPPSRLYAELERRFGVSGHEEKASRKA